jgi:hypothetical protein
MTAKNKLEQYFKKNRIFFYKVLSIIFLIGAAYVYGTFNPNKFTVKKIVHNVESKIVETAHSFGIYEPTFKYNDPETFVIALKDCIDYVNFKTEPSKRVPSAIIIGMAGIESAWGTSRFAKEGHNLFGIRTWDNTVPQIKPLDIPNADFGVKKFKTKCQSVKAMVNILNNHPAYRDFRAERQKQYESEEWNYRALLEKLDAWSTNPKYAGIVFDAIKSRQLP